MKVGQALAELAETSHGAQISSRTGADFDFLRFSARALATPQRFSHQKGRAAVEANLERYSQWISRYLASMLMSACSERKMADQARRLQRSARLQSQIGRWEMSFLIVLVVTLMSTRIVVSAAPSPNYPSYYESSLSRYTIPEMEQSYDESDEEEDNDPAEFDTEDTTTGDAVVQPVRYEKDEFYKAKKEWWKDPLSMFEDDEGDEEASLSQPADIRSSKGKEVMEPAPELKLDYDEEEGIDYDNDEEDDDEKEEEFMPPALERESSRSRKSSLEKPTMPMMFRKQQKQQPEKLSRHKMLPEETVTKETTVSVIEREARSPSSSSTAASLALVFSKLLPKSWSLRDIFQVQPLLQIVGLFVVGKALVEWVVDKERKMMMEQNHQPQVEMQTILQQDDVDQASHVSTSQQQQQDGGMRAESDYDYDFSGDDGEADYADGATPGDRAWVSGGASGASAASSMVKRSAPSFFNMFGRRRQDQPHSKNIPAPAISLSRNELVRQLEDAQKQCQSVEQQKAALQKDYETANKNYEEAKAQMERLQQNSEYLQAQLRDNQDVLQRAVTAERLKAKDELVRMKESMIKIVERERQAMRQEFLQQAQQLETLWSAQQSVTSHHRGRSNHGMI